jgi:hypothetical protein
MYGRWVEEPVVVDMGEWVRCEHPNVVVVDGVERCVWCEPEGDTTTPMVGVLACVASAVMVVLVVWGLVFVLRGRL